MQYGNIGKGDEGISYLTSSFDRIGQGYEIIENQLEPLFLEKQHLEKYEKKLVSFLGPSKYLTLRGPILI